MNKLKADRLVDRFGLKSDKELVAMALTILDRIVEFYDFGICDLLVAIPVDEKGKKVSRDEPRHDVTVNQFPLPEFATLKEVADTVDDENVIISFPMANYPKKNGKSS